MQIKLFGKLGSLAGKQKHEVPFCADVGALLERLRILTGKPDLREMFAGYEFIILVNGKKVSNKVLDTPLNENDDIVVMSPIIGG